MVIVPWSLLWRIKRRPYCPGQGVG